jgi:hypothetical protein
MGLWTLFYQATLHSEGALQSSHHHSLTRRRIWCPRFKAAQYAHRMPSSKMNSFVILATNTQIFSGRHPTVHVRITSFKMGWLPQIQCVECSIGSAVFRAIRRQCQAWQQSHTPQCWQLRGMVFTILNNTHNIQRLIYATTLWTFYNQLHTHTCNSRLLTFRSCQRYGHINIL